ncbi:hypothetical protein ACVWW4_007386 [Bradyrhizobium sp. LB7.1]
MRLTLNLKTVLIAVVVLAASFFVSLKAMDWLSPRATNSAPPVAQLPPLPPVAKSSIVVAPVAIALSAIREQAEKAAPRNFAGKAENPISQILQDADIGWSAVRGPMSAAGDKDVLTISTPLNGKLNVTGSLSSKATGALGEALGSVLGGDAAKRIGAVNIKNLNASAEIKGQCGRHLATEARGQLAPRAQSRRPGQSRRHQPQRRRRQGQRAGAGEAADRQECRRADQHRLRAHPQRSFAAGERESAMGQGLPLDRAARLGLLGSAAVALAGDEADPRHRGAAARRRAGRDPADGPRA